MQIDISIKGLDAAMLAFDSKKVTSAARMAVNEAVTAGRTAADRQVRKHWNLKTTRTKKEITRFKNATNSDLTGIIQAKGRPIDLINFGARWKRGKITTTGTKSTMGKRLIKNGGVFVTIERGKTTRLPHSFIGRVGSHIGVLERSGRERLPIKKQAVITMASMVDQPRVMLPTMKQISDRMNQRFWYHIDRLL